MKVIVFGGSGQLGRALSHWAPRTVKLHALTRSDADIGDAAQVAAAFDARKPDLVINAAAYTAVDAAETDPAEAMRINGEAPGHIARACRLSGARLVHISTDYVFDGGATRPYRPDDAVHPLSVYGRSKRAGEDAVRQALPEALLVRSQWLYAATGRNFVTTMLDLMARRDAIDVVADQVGAPTHAASLARAIWALADAGARGVHHFADGGEASRHEFAVAIEAEARAGGLIDGAEIAPVTSADYPAAAPRPRYSVLDCSKTWAITGAPRHWRDELRVALAGRKAMA